MGKISFDNFTINLDISGQMGFSSKFLVQILISNVRNKVHIINYTALDINKLINECKLELQSEAPINDIGIQSKVVIAEGISKNINSVESYAKSLGLDDYLLIIGGERLLTFIETTSIVQTKFGDWKGKLHFLETENWIGFAHEIDKLFGDMQQSLQGIVLNIDVDSSSRQLILELFEESKNFSITTIESSNQNENYEKLQREILGNFEGTSLSDILSIIESNKSRLDKNTFNYMIALAYLQHGDISSSIQILESNYGSLRNEEKLILADLLININQKDRAEQILNELFELDKYLKGLLPAILRLHDQSDNFEKKKWIDIALQLDPLNPSILEFYGNWLSNNRDYSAAAKTFRELRDIMGSSPYYELVARINDLLNAPQKTSVAEAYIYNVIKENPELKNEAKYRLAKFFIDYQESLFSAYSVLTDIDFELEKPKVREIAILKFDILSDVVKASKALRKLKPFLKSRDADLLTAERSKVLLECIPILAASPNGYLSWRSFIDNSQIDNTWKESIFTRLKEALIKISNIDISNTLEQSYIRMIENEYEVIEQYQLIALLRRVKAGEFSIENNFEDFDQFVQVILTYGELNGDINYKLWCRYYLSIICSLKGKDQLANNFALSILEFYPRVNEIQKPLCVYLGLLAWGNSQYRIGRQVEGIACLISVFQFAEKLNEFYPFVEEGVNLIARFISDNKHLIAEQDKVIVNNFSEPIKEYNQALNHMLHFINGTTESIIKELENDVMLTEIKDVDWAGKVTNLVSAYMENNLVDKAVELLEKHGIEAIENLSNRIDLRYKIILSWAQIYFYHVNNTRGYKKAIYLLEIALEDIEHKREVYHKEERASVGESSEKIYRFYIQICSLLYGLQDTSDDDGKIMREKIERVFSKISPRSILEQKKYNMDKEITPEMGELKQKLTILTEEYNNLFKKNSNHIELLQEKAKQIEEITKELKNVHPHYKALPVYRNVRFENIQKSLEGEEVFYQFIITPMTVITLLITRDVINLKSKFIFSEKMNIEEMSRLFSTLIQDDEDYDVEIESLTLTLSRAIADDLIQHVSLYKTNRIYLMQDFKMGLFPTLITKIENICLIDKVNSIVNIIDYNVIGQREKSEMKCFNVLNRIIGRETNSELKKINQWLDNKKDETFIVMENFSDDVDDLLELTSGNNINTVIIYGHGTPDPKASLIDGAQGVEGQKKLIRIDEVLDKLQDIKNFILISCRGGSPYSSSPENSTGSWANMFEGYNGNIISCKWDVPTNSTVYIVNEMLDQIKQNKLGMGEALIIAQRKAKEKYKNPMYWAGIEFWEN